VSGKTLSWHIRQGAKETLVSNATTEGQKIERTAVRNSRERVRRRKESLTAKQFAEWGAGKTRREGGSENGVKHCQVGERAIGGFPLQQSLDRGDKFNAGGEQGGKESGSRKCKRNEEEEEEGFPGCLKGREECRKRSALRVQSITL